MRTATMAGLAGVGILGLFFFLNPFMGIIKLIISLIIWMIIGNVAGQFVRGKDYGIIGNILLGIAGGVVGSIIFWVIGLGGVAGIPIIGSIIVGVVGAVIFVLVMRLFNGTFAK